MAYDITENKNDLHFIQNVEANSIIDHLDMECAHPELFTPNGPKRSINSDRFVIEVLELYQDKNVVTVSQNDVLALAMHFGIIGK